jgi:hypothetical protein
MAALPPIEAMEKLIENLTTKTNAELRERIDDRERLWLAGCFLVLKLIAWRSIPKPTVSIIEETLSAQVSLRGEITLLITGQCRSCARAPRWSERRSFYTAEFRPALLRQG